MLLLVATDIHIYGNRTKCRVKKNIIAAYIHISGNNENHNNTFQRNVDIPWMGNACKHWQSTCGLKGTDVAVHTRTHGNKMCATNAELRLRNIGLTIPGNCLSKSGGFHEIQWISYGFHEIWRISGEIRRISYGFHG